jgi:predicted methyltransferase
VPPLTESEDELRLVVCLCVLAAACSTARAAPQAPSTPAPSASPHTLVHRFEHAEMWAREFDDPARDAWQRPAQVVELMSLEPGMVVADLGAGTGYFEPWLSRAVGPRGVVWALDVEPSMVRYLADRSQREKLPNVRPTLVSSSDPGLAAGSIDRILIVDTWHHIDSREAYAGKLREALSPQGRVFIVDFKPGAKRGPPAAYRLSPEQVMRELIAGGLSATLADASLPEQYVVIGSR